MNHSQNNKKYARFNFENFNEKGLSPFKRLLFNVNAEVASVTASNRKVKRQGLFTKSAELFFKNGQRAKITIGDAGDIVSIAINGKAFPHGEPKSIKDFAKTISDILKKGQPAFDKSLAKKLKSVNVESLVKPASKSASQKIADADNELVQANDNLRVASKTLEVTKLELERYKKEESAQEAVLLELTQQETTLRQQIRDIESQL